METSTRRIFGTDRFREIIDSHVVKTVSAEVDIHKQIISEYNLNDDDSATVRVIQQLIQEEVCRHLSTTDKDNRIPNIHLKYLKREFMLEYLVYNRSRTPYYHILETESYFKILGKSEESRYLKSTDQIDDWIAGLRALYMLYLFNKSTLDRLVDDSDLMYQKDINLAEAGKKLISMDFKPDIINGTLRCPDGVAFLVDDIERRISAIGGVRILKQFFMHLSNRYDKNYKRYMLVRTPALVNMGTIEPQIPYGLLLNIIVKHLGEPSNTPSPANLNKEFETILHYARIIGVMYDVQPYSVWEDLFHTVFTIQEHLVNSIIYDKLFMLDQMNPDSVEPIIEGMFSSMGSEDFRTHTDIDLEVLRQTIRLLIDLTSDVSGPQIIASDKILAQLLSQNKADACQCLDLLSNTKDKVNLNYSDPTNFEEVNLFLKPLIKLDSSTFLMPDPSVSAPSFYEAVAGLFWEEPTSEWFNSFLGNALEHMLRSKLKELNIPILFGKYEDGDLSGDCDLMVESDDAIVIFEMKMKPLTRKAKSGIDINLFFDLAGSLIKSQEQLAKMEYLLQSSGGLELRTNNSTTRHVIWDNRAIEKISVNFFEWGGFQDRTFLIQFLSLMVGCDLTALTGDPEDERKIDTVNQALEKLRKIISKASSHDPSLDLWKFFFNSWYLSISHLLALLKESSDKDSFINNLKESKHILTGQRDFYAEHKFAKHI